MYFLRTFVWKKSKILTIYRLRGETIIIFKVFKLLNTCFVYLNFFSMLKNRNIFQSDFREDAFEWDKIASHYTQSHILSWKKKAFFEVPGNYLDFFRVWLTLLWRSTLYVVDLITFCEYMWSECLCFVKQGPI